MDTDDLSNETYEAILSTAEKFDHDLTLQFGLLADRCKDDNDYLQKAKLMIIEWKANLPESIASIFFDKRPANASFKEILSAIEHKIEDVMKIPIEKRSFEF